MSVLKNIAYMGAAAVTALSLATGAQAADVQIALDGPADLERSGSYVWAHAFAERLKQDGMDVRELPRGAVGGEAEVLDQVSTGLIQVSLSNVKSVGSIDPLIYGVRLPFIFDDLGHMDRTLESGNVLSKVNERVAKADIMLAALVPLGRAMGIFNTRHVVEKPADLSDLRMRALDESHVKIFEAWGTSATVVSWGEVPTALQTGIVDGYLQTPLVPIVFGHTDFVKYFSDVRVTLPLRAVIISRSWYQGLSDAEQATVDAAIKAGTVATRAWQVTARDASMKALEKAGVTITAISDENRDLFREMSRPVWSSGLLDQEAADFWVETSKAAR